MWPIIQLLSILPLFFFLNHSIHTSAFHPSTPRSADAIYDWGHSGIHLVSQDSTRSAPKLRKKAFGSLNTIATGVIIVLTVLNIVVYKLREIHEANLREKYKPSEQSCRQFLLADILAATKNFDDSLVVGQGGFGKVHKGVIEDGTISVAIKRLNSMSKQGAIEFQAEIEMLSRIRHSNIVYLIGYCDDCEEMILVYDYMVHGTLAENIHRNSTQSNLPWAQRLKICIGAAHGLNYLHTGTGNQNRIIHRDVKSSNILLAENWIAKISDFGMSKTGPTNQLHTHVSTNVKGTFGYVDPEYLLTRQLTRKSDVYSFGVVLFEVLCGRRAVDLSLDAEQRGLAEWAQQCIKEGDVDQIIDPSLRGEILPDSLDGFAQIADQCLQKFPKERPTMAEVVVALELALINQERTDFSIFSEDFFNIGVNHDNHAESSIKEEAVINNQGNADSSVKEQVVVNANNDDSRVKPGSTLTFTKMVRQFIFGTGLMISAHSEVKPSKNNSSGNGSVGHIGDQNLKMFKFAELVDATKNFRRDMLIGQGRFGMVYKGLVVGVGMAIAVKKLCIPFLQYKVLKLKLEFLAKLGHPNLVKILGYCWEDDKFYIVHEYMQEGSLESRLFENSGKALPWFTRLKITIQAAQGLAFLHTSEKVIYGEFKTSNILLDGEFNAKLSDFELAKAGRLNSIRDPNLEQSFFFRYASPECMTTGRFSLKGDVYCFGVMMLEILTGQRALSSKKQNLVEWARLFLIDIRKLMMVMDPCLEGQYPPKCAFKYGLLVSKCLDLKPKRRPSMEEVFKSLEHIINQDETK